MLSHWFDRLCASCKREDGQTMVEYGLVLAVITVGTIAVFTALSAPIAGAIKRVIGLIPG